LKTQKLFVVIENGFGNLDLWAVESFGKVMEILTAQGVRTLSVDPLYFEHPVWWLFLLSGSWGQNTGVAFCLCII
jgi:hypothetical protein